MGRLGAETGGPEMARLLVQAGSPSLQASSLSAQAKAAAPQVDVRNWNWEKKILCPNMR